MLAHDRFRRFWAIFLLLFASGAVLSAMARPVLAEASAPASPAGPMVDATTLGSSPTIYLNTWRFHMGDSPDADGPGAPSWADPAFDDSQWPLITTDKPLAAQGFKQGFPGFCWYRVHIRVPAKAGLSIYLSEVLSSYQVFADGRKLGGFGGLPPHEVRYYTTARSYALPPAAEPETMVLAVRVWAHPVQSPPGIETAASYLGNTAAIADKLALVQLDAFHGGIQDIVSSGVELVMGVVLLAVYFGQRSQREWLWLGLSFLAFSAIDAIFDIQTFTVIRSVWGETVGAALIFLDLAVSFEFILVFVGARPKVWMRALQGLMAAAALVSLCNANGFISHEIWSLVAGQSVAIYAVFALVLLAVWFARGNREAGILLVPVGLLYISIVGNLLGEAAYGMGLQHTKFAHSVLPSFSVLGGAFSSDFLFGIAYVLAILLILLRRSAKASRESQQLEAEIAAARTVQQVLIPELLPSVRGLSIESAYLPAQQVGGDFFQIIPLADGAAFIVVGDVSGKGLKAAMTVALIVGTLRTLAEYVASPAELLAGLNRRLHGRGSGFSTCLALRIAPDGEVIVANAGHLSPYLDGVEVATDNNLPLGLTLDVAYTETRLHLSEGQTLTLVTDGVVEATAHTTRELFGFDRTQAISTQTANAIAEAAHLFGAGAPQADDITVLTVARPLSAVAVMG